MRSDRTTGQQFTFGYELSNQPIEPELPLWLRRLAWCVVVAFLSTFGLVMFYATALLMLAM